MSFLLILFAACLLDMLLGDPLWLPHPIRLIGSICEKGEAFTRSLSLSPKNMGRVTVLIVLVFTAAFCMILLIPAAFFSTFLFWLVATLLLWTTLAARDLIRHARAVYASLDHDITLARQKVGMIVGRDTARLDKAGIIRACVESVSENMSDGIVAPLFWATNGAACGLNGGGLWPVGCAVTAAMLYKAINTMDSMFGYKNEQYLDFGSCAAILDDLVNYLPARITGLALVAAALFWGNARQSFIVMMRDHGKHTSPNAGWPEAAAAGALGIQLGGESWYFGKLSKKPHLGEDSREPVEEDIEQANRLTLAGSLLCLLLFSLFYGVVVAVVA
jgi:adenosylcobinamide-phosphate synthase